MVGIFFVVVIVAFHIRERQREQKMAFPQYLRNIVIAIYVKFHQKVF